MNAWNPWLTVIVPAYNEERRIGATLETMHTWLMQQPWSWELLIVLDGVRDRTLEVVQQFAEQRDFPEGQAAIRWIDRAENRGKGYTVREGLLAARGAVRLFADADNSTDISHFGRMAPLFQQGTPVVICSRDSKDVPGAQQAVPQPFLKRLMGNAGNLLIQAVAVPGIWDTQCGFKAFSADAAQRIASVARIDRYGFDIEALALARHFGYPIRIVPAYWIDNADTHVTPSDYLRTFQEAFRVRWNLIRGRYDHT
jgi:dolichyl-phosphate beta-glucosyltransferase